MVIVQYAGLLCYIGGTVRRLRKGSQYLDGDKVVKGYEKEGVDRKLKWHYCITVGNAVVAGYGYVPYQYTPQGKGRPLPPFAITYNKPDEIVTDAETERDGGEWYLSNSRYIVNRFNIPL